MARAPRLLTLSLVVEVDDAFDAQGESELDRALNTLIDAAEAALPLEHPNGVTMAWSTTLDPRGVNCGQCVTCGAWVTDMEATEPVQGLGHGLRLEGQLYCEDDRPEGH